MKKLLLALLAVSSIGAVQAQSSVSIYGILDVGYSGISTRSSTPATGTLKSQTNKFDQSPESTSRLGFKGNEDLGNGTSAFFTACLLYTSPSPRDYAASRMPSSA